MKTLGLCSTAVQKVIQVLGITGKKIENKEEIVILPLHKFMVLSHRE